VSATYLKGVGLVRRNNEFHYLWPDPLYAFVPNCHEGAALNGTCAASFSRCTMPQGCHFFDAWKMI